MHVCVCYENCCEPGVMKTDTALFNEAWPRRLQCLHTAGEQMHGQHQSDTNHLWSQIYLFVFPQVSICFFMSDHL